MSVCSSPFVLYKKGTSKKVIEEIRTQLFSMQDLKYRDFQSKLIPTVEYDTVIGVRTPELRKYAKQLVKTWIDNSL